jgi:hypothetical protein
VDVSIFDPVGVLVAQPAEHGRVFGGVDDGSAQLNSSVASP